MRVICLIGTLLVVGCSNAEQPGFPATLYVQDDVAAETLLAAADVWNDAAGRELFSVAWGVGREGDCHAISVFVRDDVKDAHGRFRIRGCERTIEIDQSESDNLYVAMHELGHMLGLEHSDEPRSPMFAGGLVGADDIDVSMTDKARPTQTDVEQVLLAL